MSEWTVERAVPAPMMMRPMNPRRLAEGLQEGVTAATLEISNGCLVFKDAAGAIVRAYGTGGWTSVSPGIPTTTPPGGGQGNGNAPGNPPGKPTA